MKRRHTIIIITMYVCYLKVLIFIICMYVVHSYTLRYVMLCHVTVVSYVLQTPLRRFNKRSYNNWNPNYIKVISLKKQHRNFTLISNMKQWYFNSTINDD